MKNSKFSEEQIVRILKEIKAGAKVAETCRKRAELRQKAQSKEILAVVNAPPSTSSGDQPMIL